MVNLLVDLVVTSPQSINFEIVLRTHERLHPSWSAIESGDVTNSPA